MKTITALLVSLALLVPAAALAATGSHATHVVTAQVPDGTVPPGFGGSASTYDATLTPPAHPGCGSARTLAPAATDGNPGDVLTFALHAPRHGWCHGTYRVVVHQHVTVLASPDAGSPPVTSMTTTVLARTSFRGR